MSADTTRSGDALALAEADRPSDDIDFKDVRLSARRSSASGWGRLQRGRVYGVSKSVVDDDGAFGDCLENAATILG
ncbi:Uncharacterised protein [Mycobacterium tuberculosis]|nr:Uncharacterised protein [Mycobacterium tuberculosis]SGD42824.1 Uncharacterised protein [Mycobacterium tuberculosis]SGD52129.1 Uncharacterised protein [Mycobacterium tuberculosis]SGD89031.1 Uncharacterised protein [Mycobacterium tuberculosis]SGE60539.1 Uncharacterised protein [Mycobacterium tuberculosis]